MNNLLSNIQNTMSNNQQASLLQQQIASQNKINQLLETSAAAIACGPSCQKEKVSEELKQKYLDAETNIKNGPSLLEQAKKNYYIYVEGRPAYSAMRESELKEKAKQIGDTITGIFDDSVKAALTLNSYYNIALINSKHTEELLYKYEEENSESKKKLGNKYSDVLTNNRKTYYEQNGITELKAWYNFWWYIYYILILVFIIAIFTVTSTMSRITTIVITILLVFYPYYIHPILLKIYNIFSEIKKLFPINVYNTL